MPAAAQTAPFTFDLDLGNARRKARVIDDGELAALLAGARDKARAEGRAEGEASAAARSADATAEAARALAAGAARLAETLDGALAGMRGEAAELATMVARKLAAHLIERDPAAEIAALLADCLASLDRAPHLVIRCHPELADTLKPLAEAHAAELGFDGRLVIMGEPEIAPGDCRIEWADGGVVRDTATINADIDRRIAAYAAARPSSPHEAALPPGDDQ
jgi:flagellar assembly protein FliH